MLDFITTRAEGWQTPAEMTKTTYGEAAKTLTVPLLHKQGFNHKVWCLCGLRAPCWVANKAALSAAFQRLATSSARKANWGCIAAGSLFPEAKAKRGPLLLPKLDRTSGIEHQPVQFSSRRKSATEVDFDNCGLCMSEPDSRPDPVLHVASLVELRRKDAWQGFPSRPFSDPCDRALARAAGVTRHGGNGRLVRGGVRKGGVAFL